jgi:mediator of RNA polymerase II transcription subunit 10
MFIKPLQRILANFTLSQSLIQNLVKLSRTAPQVYVDIPPEVTNYVESSRNPDIFTREFVETVQRINQLLKGRSDALQMLQEQIAWQLTNVIPELKDDVAKAVEASGGRYSAS